MHYLGGGVPAGVQDSPNDAQQIGRPLVASIDTRVTQPPNSTLPSVMVQGGAVTSTNDKIVGKMVEGPLDQKTIKEDMKVSLKRKLESLKLSAKLGLVVKPRADNIRSLYSVHMVNTITRKHCSIK